VHCKEVPFPLKSVQNDYVPSLLINGTHAEVMTLQNCLEKSGTWRVKLFFAHCLIHIAGKE